jgi:hypothetical protein
MVCRGAETRSRGRASVKAGTMNAATTTWLIDNTTFVAVLASLAIGRMKEASRPIVARATNAAGGREAQRRHAAANTVPVSPPSNRAA